LGDVELGLREVKGRLIEVEYRTTALEKRTGVVEITLEDIRETVHAVAKAVDTGAIMLLNHEKRMTSLENARPA
jgi:uncharacterized coiled-coil protein SlyX